MLSLKKNIRTIQDMRNGRETIAVGEPRGGRKRARPSPGSAGDGRLPGGRREMGRLRRRGRWRTRPANVDDEAFRWLGATLRVRGRGCPEFWECAAHDRYRRAAARLALLLEGAGVDPHGHWLLAEGADAASMSRSVAMAMDDAIVALHQNGYPLHLLLPGCKGNLNVEWPRRIKVIRRPTTANDETSKYTIPLPTGKALQSVFPIGAKSVITLPSSGAILKGTGLYKISGHGWSGYGKIARVDTSADAGKSWAPAVLQKPVLPKTLRSFRRLAVGRQPCDTIKPRYRQFGMRPAGASSSDRRARHKDNVSLQWY
jgi:hypothetical protein